MSDAQEATVELGRYEGFYVMPSFVIDVRVIDGQLTASMPGVPPGFEVRLRATSEPHTFCMEGGPLDGLTTVFRLDDGNRVIGLLAAGEYELERQDEAPAESDVPTGQGLHPPELEMTPAKERAFGDLLSQILDEGDGREIAYHLPYPKYEFLMYAAMQEAVIFHGSVHHDIDLFSTKRTSMELNDRSGRGNVQGVYGTHDGLWPLFFAIVDREKITGSIRNGFTTYAQADGRALKVYMFSINKDWLPERPWRQGTLYFLPRDTFRRMLATVEGGVSNEWVSTTPVKPLARLTIEPEDFPFLEQIGGHDDSALLDLGKLGDQLTSFVVAAEYAEDKVGMKLAYSRDVGQLLLDYFPLLHQFIPTCRISLRFEPENEVWFELKGPPAVVQVFKDRVQTHLAGGDEPA